MGLPAAASGQSVASAEPSRTSFRGLRLVCPAATLCLSDYTQSASLDRILIGSNSQKGKSRWNNKCRGAAVCVGVCVVAAAAVVVVVVVGWWRWCVLEHHQRQTKVMAHAKNGGRFSAAECRPPDEAAPAPRPGAAAPQPPPPTPPPDRPSPHCSLPGKYSWIPVKKTNKQNQTKMIDR